METNENAFSFSPAPFACDLENDVATLPFAETPVSLACDWVDSIDAKVEEFGTIARDASFAAWANGFPEGTEREQARNRAKFLRAFDLASNEGSKRQDSGTEETD